MIQIPRRVGVIQLPPLAGSPDAADESADALLQNAGLAAVKEAEIFAQAGFDGIILENTGDAPHSSRISPEVIASMAIVCAAVREVVPIQIGVRLLRKGSREALAIASVTGCDFVPFLVTAQASSPLSQLARMRKRFQSSVTLLAEVNYQIGQPLGFQDFRVLLEGFSEMKVDGVILKRKLWQQLGGLDAIRELGLVAKELQIPLVVEDVEHLEVGEIQAHVSGIIGGTVLRKVHAYQSILDPKKVREYIQNIMTSSRSGKARQKKK